MIRQRGIESAHAVRGIPLRDHHAQIREPVDDDDLDRPLEDWSKLIGDVPLATAILDPLLHHADVITIAGKSYRLKNRAGKPPRQEKGGSAEPADNA
jgi:hypothetical protein